MYEKILNIHKQLEGTNFLCQKQFSGKVNTTPTFRIDLSIRKKKKKKKESTSQSSRMIRMATTSGSGIFLENLMTVKAPESRY
jgi:hypothetical protein